MTKGPNLSDPQFVLDEAARAFIVMGNLHIAESVKNMSAFLNHYARPALIIAQDQSTGKTRPTVRGLVIPGFSEQLPAISPSKAAAHLKRANTVVVCEGLILLPAGYLEEQRLLNHVMDIYETKDTIHKQEKLKYGPEGHVWWWTNYKYYLDTGKELFERHNREEIDRSKPPGFNVFERRGKRVFDNIESFQKDIEPPAFGSTESKSNIYVCSDIKDTEAGLRTLERALENGMKVRKWQTVQFPGEGTSIFLTPDINVLAAIQDKLRDNGKSSETRPLATAFDLARKNANLKTIFAAHDLGLVLITNNADAVFRDQHAQDLKQQATEIQQRAYRDLEADLT